MTTGYSFGGAGCVFWGGGMISGRLASGDQKLPLEVVPLPPREVIPCISHIVHIGICPTSSTGLVFASFWSEKGYRLYP